MSQCSAPVLRQEMIQLRASENTSPRCQRTAKVTLEGPFGKRGFCRVHARIWREHYRIIERIRDL